MASYQRTDFRCLSRYVRLQRRDGFAAYSAVGHQDAWRLSRQALLSENEDKSEYLRDTYLIACNESDLLKKGGLSEGDIADMILRSPDAVGVEDDTLVFASEFIMSSNADDDVRDIVVDRVQTLPGEQRDKLLNRCYLKFMLQG